MQVHFLTFMLAQIDPLQRLQSFVDRVLDAPGLVLIELLLIGAVVYTILRFFQGTRGARLVRAVFILLAASFAIVWLIAEQAESERIKVLYPYFVLGVFLVSLVAFQLELRRMLLRLGEVGWLRQWMRSQEHTVDPLVVAVERLSKRKIGALIAIEHSGEIGALLESGVRLDAALSTELLETIFWPGTPLHDLGVVVHQDRVVAAGCQFPLAEAGEVDRSLGSRHRAAVGMSHEADAVVIVVSEETGMISLAVHGQLIRGLSLDGLRSALADELGGSEKNRQRTNQPKPEPATTRKTNDDRTSQTI